MDDHFKIIEFLENLNNEELTKLGGALGLSHPKLKRMTSVCGDMVAAWLNKDDNVSKMSGEPSWESLRTALKRTGHTGLADKITQGTYLLV